MAGRLKSVAFYEVPVQEIFVDVDGEAWVKIDDDHAASEEQLGLVVEFNAVDRVYFADTP